MPFRWCSVYRLLQNLLGFFKLFRGVWYVTLCSHHLRSCLTAVHLVAGWKISSSVSSVRFQICDFYMYLKHSDKILLSANILWDEDSVETIVALATGCHSGAGLWYSCLHPIAVWCKVLLLNSYTINIWSVLIKKCSFHKSHRIINIDVCVLVNWMPVLHFILYYFAFAELKSQWVFVYHC